MQKRKFDELISYFNRKVSEMNIGTSYKMELLGMVTALGYAHEKETEERKTGRWIKLDLHAHLADHKCTACGQECYVPTCMGEPMYAYCPNCGARMEDATNG